MVYEPLYLIPCSPNIVTVRVCSKLKTNWIRLFLQIKSGRILNILRAFLIKQLFTSDVGYEMIIANSYATHTRGIIVNYPPHIPYYLEEYELCCAKFCLDDQRMVESRVKSLAGSAVIWPLSSFCLMPYSLNCLHFWLKTIKKNTNVYCSGFNKPLVWRRLFATKSKIHFVFFIYIFNNYSSSPNGLWVNSPWGRRPNGLLTQRPWGIIVLVKSN